MLWYEAPENILNEYFSIYNINGKQSNWIFGFGCWSMEIRTFIPNQELEIKYILRYFLWMLGIIMRSNIKLWFPWSMDLSTSMFAGRVTEKKNNILNRFLHVDWICGFVQWIHRDCRTMRETGDMFSPSIFKRNSFSSLSCYWSSWMSDPSSQQYEVTHLSTKTPFWCI